MPEYNDYPIDECAVQAEKLIEKGCNIYQKFTCAKCGSRQTMKVGNVFYRTGTCEECRHTTTITHCNYLLTASTPEAQAAALNFLKL